MNNTDPRVKSLRATVKHLIAKHQRSLDILRRNERSLHDTPTRAAVVYTTVDNTIDREIAEHSKWCHTSCDTFLAASYREARTKYDAATVQRDYDLCHIWR